MTNIIIFCIALAVLMAICYTFGYLVGLRHGTRKAMGRWLKGGKG